MSHFPQGGPYGGPYPFQAVPPQYAPPPPLQPPNYTVPQQPYPQQHHPQGYGGPPVPQNGPVIQYANAGSYQGNAHYNPQPPNSAMPHQQPPQPYYGYGQYVNGAPSSAFGGPSLSTYNPAPPPPGLNQGMVQSRPSSAYALPPKAVAPPSASGFGAATKNSQYTNNGNHLGPSKSNDTNTVKPVNGANTTLSRPASGQVSAEHATSDFRIASPKAPMKEPISQPNHSFEMQQAPPSKGTEKLTSDNYTPPQPARLDTPQEIVDLNTPEQVDKVSHDPKPPAQPSHIILDTPPSERGEQARPSAQQQQPPHETQTAKPTVEMGEISSRLETAAEDHEGVELRDRKREAAKAAIKELHERQIGYYELVDETIDTDLLRGLYGELGIAIPSKPTGSAFRSTLQNGAPTSFSPSNALKAGQPAALGAAKPLDKLRVPTAELSEGEVSQTTSRRGSPIPSAPQAPAKAAPAPTKKPPPLPSAPPSKPIERKDYIAKLLAAKAAVKQSSAARVEKTAASQSPTLPRQPSVVAAQGKSATSPAAPTGPTAVIEIPSDGSVTDKRNDVKSTAKTELVRQRLEALQSNSRPPPTQAVEEAGRIGSSKPADDAMQLDQAPPSAPDPVIAPTSQQSPITPDASFFALGDRKSWGGLPGLGGFALPGLGSSSFEAPAPPVQPRRFSAENAPLPSTMPMSRQSSGGRPRTGEHPLPAKPSISTAPSTPVEPPASSPSAPARPAVANEPRKRAVALDFIDGPSGPPSKRPMMSKEPISLVIEVSDNDEEETPRPPLSATRPPPVRSDSSGGSKSFRDGPPLSNFPASRPGPPLPSAQTAATPPKTGQNPKGLAQTEEQIRKLQQRIAEMESRKKAKQQSSSASTPRAAATTATPAVTAEDEAVASKTQALEDKRQTLESASQALAAQQESLAAAQTQVAETLETGQKSQALIRAKVDAETRAAARATSQKQREARLARKAQLEAALPQLDEHMAAAQDRLDIMVRQQQEIQAEIQRGDEGRQTLLKELDELSALLEERLSESPELEEPALEEAPDDDPKEEEARVEQHHLESEPAEEQPVEEEPAKDEAREKSPIEEDLPTEAFLDPPPSEEARGERNASAERRSPPMKEHEVLEPTSAVAVDLRSASVSVLGQFSPPRQASPPVVAAPDPTQTAPRRQPTDVTTHEATMDISDTGSDEGQIIESRQSTHEPPALASDADMESGEEYEPPAADAVPTIADSKAVNGGAPVYEIVSTPEDADMDLDLVPEGEDDEYEPEDADQLDADRASAAGQEASIGQGFTQPEASSPGSDEDQEMAIDSGASDQEATQLPDGFAPNGAHQSLAQASSPSSNNASEEGEIDEAMGEGTDGEYEPPETTPPLDSGLIAAAVEALPVPADPSVGLPTNDQIPNVAPDDGPVPLASSSPDNAARPAATSKAGATAVVPATEPSTHYTPYKSPLARFRSFRWHPDYLQTVPGGFRSLTYSHNIDPRQSLCKWELAGGTCNDRSCEFQHFRDLALTDNTILLQLGSVQEGSTPEEKEAYISGLKDIITNMRSRNLKDVSAVLAEIVAYRARFLGDKSRVLTNLG